MTIAHHTGGLPREPHFGLNTDETHPVTVDVTGLSATLTTGELLVWFLYVIPMTLYVLWPAPRRESVRGVALESSTA